MTRKKNLECHDASLQRLSLTLVFSEVYQIMVSGFTCCIVHDTIRLLSGKNSAFVQGAILSFICRCSSFFSCFLKLFFSFSISFCFVVLFIFFPFCY